MGRPPAKLSDKHWKALQLIEAGELTLKQIADASGISRQSLYDLYEGDSSKEGEIATLFQVEIRRIERDLVKKIQKLTKSNKKHAHELIQQALVQIKERKVLRAEDMKLIATLNNSIAKSTPNVEIGSLTYNYTKGLSAEDLVNEFTRLRTITEGASQRGAVQKTKPGRSGILYTSSSRGDNAEEEQETP